jgi:CoA-transferase family III
MSVLSGVGIVEVGGIGPAPFCGMLLADLGAGVILVERPEAGRMTDMVAAAIFNRGKRSIAIDLRSKRGAETALRLIDGADGLIEGMRPGVMERLGLGRDAPICPSPLRRPSFATACCSAHRRRRALPRRGQRPRTVGSLPFGLGIGIAMCRLCASLGVTWPGCWYSSASANRSVDM